MVCGCISLVTIPPIRITIWVNHKSVCGSDVSWGVANWRQFCSVSWWPKPAAEPDQATFHPHITWWKSCTRSYAIYLIYIVFVQKEVLPPNGLLVWSPHASLEYLLHTLIVKITCRFVFLYKNCSKPWRHPPIPNGTLLFWQAAWEGLTPG